MKAVIPAKTNSERIPNKNFRPFFGKLSLFDIKARQLLTCLDADDIYVSTESETMRPVIEGYGFHFLLRDYRLTLNETPIPEFVMGVMADVPGDDDIMWTQLQDPGFRDFTGARDKWLEVKEDYDSLVVVRAFRDYIWDEHGHPLNSGFGPWHVRSQQLPKWYLWTFCLQILPRATFKTCRYYLGANPYRYVSDAPTIDIDTADDFAIAREVYGRAYGGENSWCIEE